jgi:hypothetical protein
LGIAWSSCGRSISLSFLNAIFAVYSEGGERKMRMLSRDSGLSCARLSSPRK